MVSFRKLRRVESGGKFKSCSILSQSRFHCCRQTLHANFCVNGVSPPCKLLPADECQYQWVSAVRTGIQEGHASGIPIESAIMCLQAEREPLSSVVNSLQTTLGMLLCKCPAQDSEILQNKKFSCIYKTQGWEVCEPFSLCAELHLQLQDAARRHECLVTEL